MVKRSTIRVMIVDDHEMVREGLGMFLRTCDDLELVASVDSGDKAVAQCLECEPDVILMDLIMPGRSGISATKAIKEKLPDTQVIALTSYSDESLVKDALAAGAIGYIFKSVSIDTLAKSIRSAYEGIPVLAAEATNILISSTQHNSDPPLTLTIRELEVLELMVEGLSNPQIGSRLFISSSTVKSHVSNILSKMEVSTRAGASALAVRKNLVS